MPNSPGCLNLLRRSVAVQLEVLDRGEQDVQLGLQLLALRKEPMFGLCLVALREVRQEVGIEQIFQLAGKRLGFVDHGYAHFAHWIDLHLPRFHERDQMPGRDLLVLRVFEIECVFQCVPFDQSNVSWAARLSMGFRENTLSET